MLSFRMHELQISFHIPTPDKLPVPDELTYYEINLISAVLY